MGNSTAALEAGERALAFNGAMLRLDGDSETSQEEAARETVRILSLLGLIHKRAGCQQRAEEDYRHALEVCRERDDRPGMVTIYNNLGVTRHFPGNYSLRSRLLPGSPTPGSGTGIQRPGTGLPEQPGRRAGRAAQIGPGQKLLRKILQRTGGRVGSC